MTHIPEMMKHFLLKEKDATFLRKHVSKAAGLLIVLNLNRGHCQCLGVSKLPQKPTPKDVTLM